MSSSNYRQGVGLESFLRSQSQSNTESVDVLDVQSASVLLEFARGQSPIVVTQADLFAKGMCEEKIQALVDADHLRQMGGENYQILEQTVNLAIRKSTNHLSETLTKGLLDQLPPMKEEAEKR